jgi:hypothetical protein
VLRDPNTGEVIYVGRTNDADRRRDEHERNRQTPSGEPYDFDLVYPTDDYAEQRGLEEHLYNLNVDSGNLQNKIKPISDRNPKGDTIYRPAAQDYLKRPEDNSG